MKAEKRCRVCGVVKPLSEFLSNSRAPDGRWSFCKDCRADRGTGRTHEDRRHYKIVARYGVSSAEVDELIRKQGGVCAICQESPAVQVDHDHRGGDNKIRGVLCDGFNGGLGAFEDDPALIRAAIDYLPEVEVTSKPPANLKKCSRCGQVMPEKDFGRNRSEKDGVGRYVALATTS